MKKKIAIVVVAVLVAAILASTIVAVVYSARSPVEPTDDMPMIWEDGFWVEQKSSQHCDIDISLSGKSEITVTADQDISHISHWTLAHDLENIYVEDGHPLYVSEDGVLYTKSFETLVRWPAKKPVTKPKDSIKYFAPQCYWGCDFTDGFELPDGTVTIGECAFIYATNLSSIHVKKNVRGVGPGVFSAPCIKRIEVSAPVTYRNFYNSRYVETIVFNEGVEEIKWNAGYDYRPYARIMMGLKSVQFSTTLKSIEGVCFPVNIAVERYELNSDLTNIDDNAFFDYVSAKFSGYSIKRPAKTEFSYRGEVATRYFDKMQPIWDEHYNARISKQKA